MRQFNYINLRKALLLHFKYFPISKKKCFTNNRSSHQKCSMKKGVLKNFTKFTGKHLCQSLFYNKFAGLSPATLIKKKSDIGVFLRVL